MKERIAYILNPEKTEGMFWCNSYNCMTNAEDAYLNMKFIYETFNEYPDFILWDKCFYP